jgi:hypothetical protein
MILGTDNRKATNVSEWLEIATKGIAAAGKERIEREIEAHYADAVEAHRERGESEEVAHTKSLEELGEPGKAAEKFQQEYLTEEDEKNMVRILQAAREPWKSVSIAVCFTVLPLFVYFDSALGRLTEWRLVLISAAWLTTCFVLPAISFTLAKRLSFEEGIRWLVRIEASRWLILGWVPYLLGYVYTSRKDPLSMLVLVSASWPMRRVLLLGAKLRKARAKAGGTPTAA